MKITYKHNNYQLKISDNMYSRLLKLKVTSPMLQEALKNPEFINDTYLILKFDKVFISDLVIVKDDKIKISYDKEKGYHRVTDNGIQITTNQLCFKISFDNNVLILKDFKIGGYRPLFLTDSNIVKSEIKESIEFWNRFAYKLENNTNCITFPLGLKYLTLLDTDIQIEEKDNKIIYFNDLLDLRLNNNEQLQVTHRKCVGNGYMDLDGIKISATNETLYRLDMTLFLLATIKYSIDNDK